VLANFKRHRAVFLQQHGFLVVEWWHCDRHVKKTLVRDSRYQKISRI